MRIRFASPLAKLVGKREHDIFLPQAVTADEVVRLLSDEFAQTQLFCNHYPGKVYIPHLMMMIKNGRHLLKPNDKLEDHDALEIIPPIMGG